MTRKPKRPKGGRQGLPPEAARRFRDHLAEYVAAVAGRDELKRPKRAAFAERAGLRPKTVDSWFAGRAPDLPTLVQVAQEVGWSLDGMLLDRGELQWAKPQTDPHEQLRELVMAALTPRVSGTDHATLALCVPDGRELVRLLANALDATVRVRLDALRLVRTAWRHRDDPDARELVTDARRLAEQYDLPWDDRLDRVTVPRGSFMRLNPQRRRPTP